MSKHLLKRIKIYFNVLSISAIFLLLNSCEEEFDDKGLVLISPTVSQLSTLTYSEGDTMKLEIMYKGKEKVLYMYFRGEGEFYVPENANGDGYEAYTFESGLFGGRLYDIPNNEPFNLNIPIDEDWDYPVPQVQVQMRTLYVRVVTENHILDYSYALSSQ